MKLLRSLPLRTLLLIAFVLLSRVITRGQTAGVPARVTQPVNLENLVTLQGNTHPLARPEFDQGAAPDSLPMERILLVLQRSTEQEAVLEKLLEEQQIKSSSNYHMWLTPEQFGEQFGPADADIQAVTDWLTSQGFTVNRVAAGRTVIEFSGTARTVRQGLHAEIHKFAVNGEEHWANASDPQIPAALAPVVAGFASLNNFPKKPLTRSLGTFRRSKLTGEVQPQFTFPVPCPEGTCYYFALGPADFATIYNVAPLWSAGTDGTGQTIAVVGETNINPQDVADFRSMFGLPANQPDIILNGPDPGITGDEVEADIDVEWSGAVARGAMIDLVVSEPTESTAGIDLSALYIIDNNLAPVMSESYGACEAELGAGGNHFYSTLWEQAAAQGITVLMAAGDSGSAGCDSANLGETSAQYGLAVSGLASTPFNVAVGGTDFNVNSNNALTYWSLTNNSSQASALSYIPETTWNDSCASSGSINGCTPPPSTTYLSDGIYLVAGGGGPSSCTNPSGTFPSVTCSGNYPKPLWQSGQGVPTDSARDIPDVSLFAGNGMHYTFYVICRMDANAQNGGSSTSCDLNSPYTDFQGGSGTSASAQVFAGVMALVNQRYGRQGNANYVLYPMAAKGGASCESSTTAVTNSSCIFYDVTVGNNSVICQGGSPNCSEATSGQYGIMVAASLPAYPAGVGYDLASGLGSVNVANLVNNWTSSFTPSTTSLSLSTNPPTNPITLTHGQPVDFTISVASGSNTASPTGDVSLIAQTGASSSNVTGIGPFTLSGGSVTSSTNMLPGGSYTVTAHYPGNGTLAASDSSPGIAVAVGKESSLAEIRLVTFSSTAPPAYNLTTAAYGSPYILRVDVTNSSGQTCVSATTGLISYPCPTGSLTVSPAPTDENPPAGTVPGSYVLNSQGFAEDAFIQQLPGTYNFVATYSGDNSYRGSTSPTDLITITPAPTTTALAGLPSSSVGGNVTGSVTISTQSYGAAPTGTVQLLVNGAASGPPASIVGTAYSPSTGAYATGTAGVSVTLPSGSDSVTVQYSGDSNYASSTSAATVVNVTDYSMAANPSTINISAAGQSGTSTITLTPLNGFQGTISLSCGTGFAGGTCTISPSTVSIVSSSAVQAVLTVNTTGPVGSASRAGRARVLPSFHRLPSGWPWLMAGLFALAMLISMVAARRRALGWLFATALLVVGMWVACGGGGGGGGGTAPAPQVSLSQVGLTFSQQGTGSTSSAQTVTLSNTGNAALSISSIAITGANAGDFTQTNTCGSSVAAGANCAISVTFTPAAAGSRSATLTISDNASGSPQTVGLTGTGVAAPVVSLSPSSLTFGQQNVGTTSAPQSVTLSNTGTATLSMTSLGLTGTDSADFSQTNNCGSSVASGASCALSVTFTPTAVGSRSASVSIADNASGSPQTISLSGTGAGTLAVSLSPSSLSFGNQVLDTVSANQSVTVTNTGNVALSITQVDVTPAGGDPFNFSNSCGTNLQPGANCSVQVTFSPTMLGPQSGFLWVYDNAPGSPQTAGLAGTGVSAPTPPGTYTVQIQAWSGTDNHMLNVTVTVQ